ncbi:MAG: phosphate signaling complex protein PhoU [Synergistaceae bacterium]
MRNKFDIELQELKNNLIKMGTLCESGFVEAIKAFLEKDTSYYEKMKITEERIDEEEKNIEQQCMRLILHQQPVAKDLRMVSSALKMVTDLERIGDQSCDIAELTQYTSDGEIPLYDDIKTMSQEASKMLTNAIDSFVKQDLTLAKEVIEYDDNVDILFFKIKKDLIELLRKEVENPETVIDILMVAKYLERIADHATNVAEWVVFSITGEYAEGE